MLKHSYSFEALGTPWRIETDAALPSLLKSEIQARIELFNVTYSRFRDDSLVTKISQQAGSYTFPEDAKKLFDFYKALYDITNGKVTPLIGEMISRAGYDAKYSFVAQTQIKLPTWDEAMEWDGRTLKTYMPILLDVGALGKGYLVDIIAAILDQEFEDYVIDASGDLRHKGTSENIVGLEDPFDTKKVIGAADVRNMSLCASANNRRTWGSGLHHIFDPDEMAPTQSIVATWVLADEAIIADGLATALFFVEPTILKEAYNFEYVRVHANHVVEYSPYFETKLFP
ncbi:MAG: FAD:protein FMN transferase [Patescibacteria group bacterium]